MAAAAPTPASAAPHIPVLLGPLLEAVAPVEGVWLDGTFGAGGYARGLLAAGAARVIGVDRDPLAFEMAEAWAEGFGDRLQLVEGTFSQLDTLAGEPLDGVVLDLGVSSMQLDQAERGFSFLRDGPLDMRMSQSGETAADLVNTVPEAVLADILYHYGEERASRRIARAIVAARAIVPIVSTLQLAGIVEKCLPRPKPGQSHPATRSFQAIRIAVNAEFLELIEGLEAAERALKPGGKLAVVTFHSLEDRIVKRFFQSRSGLDANANRYAPEKAVTEPQFHLLTRRADRARGGRDRREPARPLCQAAGRRADRGARGRIGPRRSRAAHDRRERPTLMRPLLYVLSALMVMSLAFWAYRQNYATQSSIKQVARLQREIAQLHESIGMQQAEWAFENRPSRLRELTMLNFNKLNLLPMTSSQFGSIDELAYPAPAPTVAPAPLGSGMVISKTVDTSAELKAQTP